MRRYLISIAVIFLVFGFTSMAAADLTFNNPAHVQFYSVDDSNDYNASISIIDLNLSGIMKLWYKIGDGLWTIYSNPFIPVLTTERGGRTLVKLAIGSDSNPSTYSAASMTFMGENLPNLPNHFDSLIVNWTTDLYAKVDFTGTSNGADNVSPVPLPGAALLLGAGLIGLVGVRRRIMS